MGKELSLLQTAGCPVQRVGLGESRSGEGRFWTARVAQCGNVGANTPPLLRTGFAAQLVQQRRPQRALRVAAVLTAEVADLDVSKVRGGAVCWVEACFRGCSPDLWPVGETAAER